MRNYSVGAAFAMALVALPVFAAPITFSGYSMNTVGSAGMVGTDLQLNSNNAQIGTAWLNSALSTTDSFSASFKFSLRSLYHITQADGISFALQNIGNAANGSGGGGIGYDGMGAVGSVVQTWDNNRAGLNINGSPYSTQFAPANLGIASLILGSETVAYDASTNLLTMSGVLNVDGTDYNISDSVTFDLAAHFGSIMYAGFTGGTGYSESDQRITDFNMTNTAPVPEPETYAMMLAGLGLLGFMARRRKQKEVAAV